MKKNKRKLILTIGLILVVGFMATSLISYFVSLSLLRSEITINELPLTSDNIYSEIQRDLLRPIFISSLMATNTFLRDWVIQGEKDQTQIKKYLRDIMEKYNTVTSFFVSEKTRLYYYPGGILKKVSPGEKRDLWYFRVLKMKKNYEINVDPDMANKDTMTIFINYRVYDYDGNYIGATGVGLTVSAVKRLIKTYQNKYHRRVFFIDQKGDLTLSGTNFLNEVKNIFQLKRYAGFAEAIRSKKEGFFRYKNGNEIVHMNSRYISEFGWYLIVEQSERKTTKNIFTTLIFNLVICAVVTIVILVLVTLTITAYQNRIETLRGIVPICSFCKKVRDDKGYWEQVEVYVKRHSEADFSHSVCPECMKEQYPELND